MDTICENAPIDTSLRLFGRTFAAPIFAAPVGAMKLHYGDKYDDLTYNDILVSSCAQAGIAAFTGDGTDPAVFTAAARAIGASGGKGIPTVKPWDRNTLFSKLDEAKANPDGTLVEGADRVKGNAYKLLPGHTYNKDPMVTVLNGSEASYIKMTVTFSKADALDTIFAPDGANLTSTFKGYDAVNWIAKGNKKDAATDTRAYEFWYKEAVGAPNGDVALDALFDSITVPGEITKEQLATIEGMTITVNAYAIQADGFANAEAAWAAFN